MKDKKYKTDKQPSITHDINRILNQQLTQLITTSQQQNIINELIQQTIRYREQKGLIYSISLSGKQYLQQLWRHFYQQKPKSKNNQQQEKSLHEEKLQQNQQQQVFQYYQPELSLYQLIIQASTKRQSIIYDQINNQTLTINKRIKPLIKIIDNNNNNLTQNNIKQLNESNTSRNSQKDFYEFVKNEKLQKEKRKKLLQKQLQKQLQIQQKRKQQQQVIKQQKNRQQQQQKRKRQKQLQQKRDIQKQLIKKHKSLYEQFQTKLFYSKQNQTNSASFLIKNHTQQQLKRLQQQKKLTYKSYQKPIIDSHEKEYLQSVIKKRQQRYKKFQEMKHIEEIEKQQSRIKYHSSSTIKKFTRPQDQYEKHRQQEYDRAKQKRDRIMLYRNRVRSNYLPEVDEEKKNQLLKLVSQLQSSRKIKRKMLKNGQIIEQKLEVKDHRQVGLEYLKNIKKQVQRMKLSKSRNQQQQVEEFREDMMVQNSNSQQQNSLSSQNKSKNSKPIDYLKQLREQSSKTQKSTSSPFSTPRNTMFANTKRSDLSFDEKLKQMSSLSDRLMEKTKQQEMLLKYGKFKTSEEILNQKQIIDKNYIDLLNMKLQMIENEI